MKSIKISLKNVILLLFIGLMVWSVGAKYITSHEFIHKQIFERHGIISESKVNLIFLSGVTTPASSLCNDSCKLEHTINDVIGYYLATFIYFIFILTLIILLYNETN